MRSLIFAAGVATLASMGLQAHAAQETAPPQVSSIEPEAQQALERMATYLRSLNTFEIRTVTSLDLVTNDGQRIQIDGGAHYKVRRPNGFVISVNTDWKKRTYYYDGKSFTIFAPELGYYATTGAPATIVQTLDVLHDRFGIALPIEDLFRWNDPTTRQTDPLSTAMYVGPATIDGAKTEHYAYRQGDIDWQLWIEVGDRPLPRKIVIVDRTDLAHPAYVAQLAWTLNPSFSTADFTFKPSQTAKPIRLTALQDGK